MDRIAHDLNPRALPWEPRRKSAAFVTHAVHGAHYWAEWSQPHGLLRIGAPPRQCGRKGVELFGFVLASRNVEEANSLCTYC